MKIRNCKFNIIHHAYTQMYAIQTRLLKYKYLYLISKIYKGTYL